LRSLQEKDGDGVKERLILDISNYLRYKYSKKEIKWNVQRRLI